MRVKYEGDLLECKESQRVPREKRVRIESMAASQKEL